MVEPTIFFVAMQLFQFSLFHGLREQVLPLRGLEVEDRCSLAFVDPVACEVARQTERVSRVIGFAEQDAAALGELEAEDPVQVGAPEVGNGALRPVRRLILLFEDETSFHRAGPVLRKILNY